MVELFWRYKYLIVPFMTWFGIQLFKVFYEYYETKKWNWKRLFGHGGMPSSHSAIIVCITTMVGKKSRN